jgi:hypothetical protein
MLPAALISRTAPMLGIAPLLLASTLVGCGGEPLSYTTEAMGCQNLVLDDVGDPTLEWAETDAGIDVYLNGVVMLNDSEFTPEVTADGDSIDVREAWKEAGDTEFCFAPTLHLKDPAPDDYEVFWFRDDSDVAFESIVFTVE